jgi:hypothetical protein
MSKWKFLVPPAAVPLALWMFVALAGPGGVIEVSSGTGSTPAADAGLGAAGVDGGADSSTGSESAQGASNGNGCEEALSEQAQAWTELEGHVADGEKPAGGVNGNLNALDKQCGGAFAEGSQEGTTPPVEQTVTGPGKSEQAPSAPAADGQAQGQGQANADANGNGAADAAGQNKP